MRALPLAVLLALAACKSTAPHTLAAAAVNTGLASGLAGAARAAGGCYAVCTYGTACNPATGYCEKEGSFTDPRSAASCPPGQICPPTVTQPGRAGTAPGASPVGVSPATGAPPPSLPPATTVAPGNEPRP